MSVMLTGCATGQKNVVDVIKDSIYIDRVKTDTIYQTIDKRHDVIVHDSVYILIKGDTVYQNRSRTQYEYVYMHDTIYRSKTDTLQRETDKQVKHDSLTVKEKKTIPIKEYVILFIVIAIAFIMIRIYNKTNLK